MRYFIFFYCCEGGGCKQKGVYGFIGDSMPSIIDVSTDVADDIGFFTPNQVSIIDFNEVNKEDYNVLMGASK